MMKRVKLGIGASEIYLKDVLLTTPIFSTFDGTTPNGLIAQEGSGEHKDRWIHKIGGNRGVFGFYRSRKECLIASSEEASHQYRFFIMLEGTPKAIIINHSPTKNVIFERDVSDDTLILVTRKGSKKIVGAVVNVEAPHFQEAWSLFLGYGSGSPTNWGGAYPTRKAAMESTNNGVKYDFYIGVGI